MGGLERKINNISLGRLFLSITGIGGELDGAVRILEGLGAMGGISGENATVIAIHQVVFGALETTSSLVFFLMSNYYRNSALNRLRDIKDRWVRDKLHHISLDQVNQPEEIPDSVPAVVD